MVNGHNKKVEDLSGGNCSVAAEGEDAASINLLPVRG